MKNGLRGEQQESIVPRRDAWSVWVTRGYDPRGIFWSERHRHAKSVIDSLLREFRGHASVLFRSGMRHQDNIAEVRRGLYRHALPAAWRLSSTRGLRDRRAYGRRYYELVIQKNHQPPRRISRWARQAAGTRDRQLSARGHAIHYPSRDVDRFVCCSRAAGVKVAWCPADGVAPCCLRRYRLPD